MEMPFLQASLNSFMKLVRKDLSFLKTNFDQYLKTSLYVIEADVGSVHFFICCCNP
jgi:hypothetical protein